MNDINNEQKLEQTDSFSELPFDSVPQNTNPSDNIIILDDRIKDIPPMQKSIDPIVTDNNIIILDDKIKDIQPKNVKISFKKTSMIFPIIAFVFVSILGMYIFINNSKADTTDLIRIEENSKVGYINDEGTIVTKPKYQYGSEYYKGLAVVKNDNNLFGVLNGKGVLQASFGTYYSIGLYGERYIASKITNSGLKVALLDDTLGEVTRFQYDSIKHSKDDIYVFTKGETMGLLNKDGDEIYTFKVDEVDDKKIEVEISPTTKDVPLTERYAKVKVNGSSTIVNVSSGREAFGFTLKEIKVLENNVFYIESESEDTNSTYMVVNSDQVKYKTDKYKRVRVEDYLSNIAIGVNNDMTIDYIDINSKKVINDSDNNVYTYGSGLILEQTHDFDTNQDIYNIKSVNNNLGSFTDYKPVTGSFSNELLEVEVQEGKYNYVNKEGNLINDMLYDSVDDFNNNGYAIVGIDNTYSLINKNGKKVISMKYSSIEYIDEDLFDNIKENYSEEIFKFKNDLGKVGLINSKDKTIIEAKYDDIEFLSDKYPFVLCTIEGKKVIINYITNKELPIEMIANDIKIEKNYIFTNNTYYNYSGNLIYTIK
ncbi:MAG: WG repeat-containing protein [Bacilli bacterium]|nr:WG repeat-containing protein [Bacilli bacterium]